MKIKINITYKILIIILILIFVIALLIIVNNKRETYDNSIELSPKLNKNDVINLKKGQILMTNMLREFNRICRKYNIKYFLVGGSLIGVLLYKGWIPWDSDIDLVINDKDYDKFKKVIQKELPKNMWFQNHNTDKYYPKNSIVTGKIRDLNSCYIQYTNNGGTQWHNGLQIDILLYSDNNNIFSFMDKNEPKMEYNDIFPLIEKPFEDINVFIMNNSKKYLDNKYGKGWVNILPIEKRIGHEGKIDATKTCQFHYKKYPYLYK